jgi:hypothetical protein
MHTFVSKHKSELFNSGLFFGLLCGWLTTFGSATLHRIGLTADYTEKTQFVLFSPNGEAGEGLKTGSPLESAVTLRISYPASIDFSQSKPLHASLRCCPTKNPASDDFFLPSASGLSEEQLTAFVGDAEFEVTVKPELDAPSFDFEQKSFAQLFQGQQQLNWQWIVTPTKEGVQSFSLDFVFRLKRKGAAEWTEYHVPSKTLEVAVVRPFITLGQINLATILTGILAGLLATPKLIEIVKSVAKRKPKQRTIGYLASRSKSNSSASVTSNTPGLVSRMSPANASTDKDKANDEKSRVGSTSKKTK